jgi:flagellar basal body rod protein FlgG
MSEGIYAALSGAVAQAQALDTVAANLASSGTQGYQRMRTVFREVLAGTSPDGAPLRYTQIAASPTDTTPGALRATGRMSDAALPPGCYLSVMTPQGERYTRAVSLQVRADGAIVNVSGHAVLGDNEQPLQAQAGVGPLEIRANGTVVQNGNDNPIGRLKLVRFENASNLTHEGSMLMAAGPETGDPVPSTTPVVAGSVEESNASVVAAMNDMVAATRTFEAFQRVIDTFRDADRRVVSTVPGNG